MSRTVVRYAVSQWLTAAEIYGLDAVYSSNSQVDVSTVNPQDPDHRCLGFVTLPSSQENRLSMGGPFSGDKEDNFTVTLILKFWASDTDWIACQDAFDTIIDLIKQQLRAGGRTLGRPDVILQAGEWTAGIHVAQGEAYADQGNAYMQEATITFEVTEILSQT